MTSAAVLELAQPSFRIWSARPHPTRSVIRRQTLLGRLADQAAPPLTVLVAPAGYGKTTLLRDWAKRDGRPFAWVTADPRDDADGERLRGSAARAVDAIAADAGAVPFVLVIDDAHVLHSGSGVDALAAIADELPPHARLAVASRRELPLPVARLRAERLVLELGPRDLAMSRAEAAKLLADAGHRLDSDALDTLLQRTEGWPVGLALAAIYLGDRGSRPNLARFGGADRLVADYVRDELLRDLPDDPLDFVVRMSIVDTLSGPLCDALLDRNDSASLLEALARDGLVLPVDRTGERYRLHRLVRDSLRAELRQREPELEPELHRRAGAWHRAGGDVERAVHHALAAEDVRAASDVVWANIGAAVADGQVCALERWLSRLTESQIAGEPRLALAAAGCELVRGHGHLVEHWTWVAAKARRAPGARGAVEAGIALMRAALGRDGAERMGEDAGWAHELLPAGTPSRALACFLGGVASRLLGDRYEATRLLEEGARGAAVLAPHVHSLCLAELAVLALERGDWEEACEHGARARAQVDRHALRDAPITALVFAVSAVTRAHRGRIEEAQADLRDAARLLTDVTDFAPWYGVEVGVLLTRAALRLSDAPAARTHLGEANRLFKHAADAVALEPWLGETGALLEAFTPSEAAQPVPMTAAELRILRYLPTHLSFREIAELTQVSANTVKTQANAVYRKFGVACRSDAVSRARTCGLLDA
jgi:LuxR family maltose regulon positive regulatory protein